MANFELKTVKPNGEIHIVDDERTEYVLRLDDIKAVDEGGYKYCTESGIELPGVRIQVYHLGTVDSADDADLRDPDIDVPFARYYPEEVIYIAKEDLDSHADVYFFNMHVITWCQGHMIILPIISNAVDAYLGPNDQSLIANIALVAAAMRSALKERCAGSEEDIEEQICKELRINRKLLYFAMSTLEDQSDDGEESFGEEEPFEEQQ